MITYNKGVQDRGRETERERQRERDGREGDGGRVVKINLWVIPGKKEEELESPRAETVASPAAV